MAPSAIDKQIGNPVWVDRDALRTDFTLAMSAMYKAEVPLYGDLVQIVSSINTDLIHQSSLDPKVLSLRYGDAQSARLDIERHGAIRLGTPHELSTIRRLFALIGLFPVGYYDLSAAGLPMHATCFRPSTEASLLKNPFRVFTSVLRPELLENQETKELAMELLSRRKIFSDKLMRLLDLGDIQGAVLPRSRAESSSPRRSRPLAGSPPQPQHIMSTAISGQNIQSSQILLASAAPTSTTLPQGRSISMSHRTR
ncbi:hypothetical protein V2G26_015635 [Clonostachys chloroleuca]